jgi:hypothetical protein
MSRSTGPVTAARQAAGAMRGGTGIFLITAGAMRVRMPGSPPG